MSDERARRSSADALCAECALCCDGTFFGSVVITNDDRERVRRVGLRVVDKDGAATMPQPCSALRGCLCAVYEERPKTCRDYECSLRVSVLAGSTSEESARMSVARMCVLLATIRAALDLPETSIWEAILKLDEPVGVDPMSPAGRKFDTGVQAFSELIELARSVFEPTLGGARAPGKQE
jgi:Fe-S-cluster containining protein